MLARGLDFNLPKPSDFEEWRAAREASRKTLSEVEPHWADHKLSCEFFAEYVEQAADAARDGKGYSLLMRNAAGELVGGLALGPIREGLAFIGSWIGDRFAGRGYAVRACDAGLHMAFGVLGCKLVGATVMADNEPSIRILEYFGFDHDPGRNVVMAVNGKPRLHLVFTVDINGLKHSSAKQRQNGIQRAA